MGNFVFQDLDFPRTVWREGDPPLVNGSGPVIDNPPAAKRRRSRLLLWLGVIACVAIGARLVAALVTEILYAPLPPANEDIGFRTPMVTVAVVIWLGICLLAIVRAWRKHARRSETT
jgi:hypothetical protein